VFSSSVHRFSRSFVVLAAVLAITVSSVSFAGERLTAERAAALVPQLFQLHLREKRLDVPFMKRMLKEVLGNLDPTKSMFTKAEADALLNLPDDQLQKLAAQSLSGDFSFYKKVLEDFLNVQVARDDPFYAALEGRKDEIQVILKEMDAKFEAQVKNGEDAKDDPDDIKWTERPADQADREKRILRAVAQWYRGNKTYLSDEEAFKQACQTLKVERERWKKLNVENEVPKLFLKSFMSAMDPHTAYFDAEEDEEFTTKLEPSFAGIGVQIRPCPLGAQVEEVIKGGPAERHGGFDKGDQIVRVDDTVLAGMPINKVVRYIKGERGTEVKLTVLKKSNKESQIIALKRDNINLGDMRVKGKAFNTPAGRVGLVSAQAFYRDGEVDGTHQNGVSEDVRDRIMDLEKEGPLAGLVLDLRDNHGGYLDEAVKMAGLFIRSGPVVGEKDGIGRISWKKDTDDTIYFEKPMVVLINQFSASASEIVAGTLQDYGRALIVGSTQSFGKGTVQRVLPLANIKLPGEIKITTHQYFVAGGGSVQQKGVEPDIKIKGGKLLEEALERADENCVPWAKIDNPLDPEHLPDVKIWQDFKAKNTAMLQENSKLRVAANKEYQDFYDIKLRRAKALERQKELEKNPAAAEELEKKDELKDFQAEEAAAIVSDMSPLWPNSSKQAAK
jgi:carboxyl-terminal processing protease